VNTKATVSKIITYLTLVTNSQIQLEIY